MLEAALEHLVKGIVDNPDDVTVDMVSGRRGRTLEVRVAPATCAGAGGPTSADGACRGRRCPATRATD